MPGECMDSGAQLAELVQARDGIVCVTGAGGKKSLMYALAQAHQGRLGFTTTVQIPPFLPQLNAAEVIEPAHALPDAVLRAAAGHRVVAYGCPSGKRGRVAGADPEQIAALHRQAGFDLTLVKADGARGRLLKVPGEGEPLLPSRVDTLIAVLSVRIIGRPLDERYVHRVPRVALVAGVPPGAILDVTHVARLLSDGDGMLRGADHARRVVVVMNMADDEASARQGVALARLVIRADTPVARVVLTCLRRASPVVDVIER